VSSPWKEKSASSFLAKIIRMDNDSTAIVLREDCNKGLRFVYLSLLMGKKNAAHMQNLIARIGQIKTHHKELGLTHLPPLIAKILPHSLEELHA
jgi:hypothetical protein